MGLLSRFNKQKDNPKVDAGVSAQLEFQRFLEKIHDASKQAVSEEWKKSRYNTLLNGLSEIAYTNHFHQIVYIIQRSKEKCERFKNTEEQVRDILSWLPRLKDHEELLTLYIKERREKYKLGV